MKKVVVVGSNPSRRSHSNNAFHESTRSGRTLKSWLINIKTDIVFINVSETPTTDNRPLSMLEIKSNLDHLKQKIEFIKPTHVVAIGKVAERALTLLQLHFYTMPHPSGRNRVCNNGRFIAEKIKGLELFVLGPNNVNKAQ